MPLTIRCLPPFTRGEFAVSFVSPLVTIYLPELDQSAIEKIICTWKDQTVELSARDFVQYVQIFENKGAMMGCSNPHPHSQVWGTQYIVNEPARELERQKVYFSEHGHPLLQTTWCKNINEKSVSCFQTTISPSWSLLGGMAV